jgi:hypothetical protein
MYGTSTVRRVADAQIRAYVITDAKVIVIV